MENTQPVTVWQCVDVGTDNVDLGRSLIWFKLASEGKTYRVILEAPDGVLASQLVNACRAAAAKLIEAAGGDMGAVGAQSASDAALDTGDQRPN